MNVLLQLLYICKNRTKPQPHLEHSLERDDHLYLGCTLQNLMVGLLVLLLIK